jgi:hypothetical protein
MPEKSAASDGFTSQTAGGLSWLRDPLVVGLVPRVQQGNGAITVHDVLVRICPLLIREEYFMYECVATYQRSGGSGYRFGGQTVDALVTTAAESVMK